MDATNWTASERKAYTAEKRAQMITELRDARIRFGGGSREYDAAHGRALRMGVTPAEITAIFDDGREDRPFCNDRE